jgi:hypothetical protein
VEVTQRLAGVGPDRDRSARGDEPPTRSWTGDLESPLTRMPVYGLRPDPGALPDPQCCSARNAPNAREGHRAGGSCGSGESCALTTYTTKNFTNGKIIADTQFTDSLDTIDGYASDASVKVHVTDSFCAKGKTPQGTVIQPATRSNHLAGQ